MPNRFRHRRIARVISVLLLGFLLTSFSAPASKAADWTTNRDERVPGELVDFDFVAKNAIFETEEGKRKEVASADLSMSSRWRLLCSPTFARSFPEEDWSKEQRRYLVFTALAPAFFLLISFYLCAIVLFKNGNPLRALSGWVGSVLLGGFLGGFYLVLSAKDPSSATGVLAFGALVSLGVLSLYVSVIYHTHFFNGLKLLVLHVVGAFLLLAISLIVVQRVSLAFDLAPLIEERLMIPVGLISED